MTMILKSTAILIFSILSVMCGELTSSELADREIGIYLNDGKVPRLIVLGMDSVVKFAAGTSLSDDIYIPYNKLGANGVMVEFTLNENAVNLSVMKTSNGSASRIVVAGKVVQAVELHDYYVKTANGTISFAIFKINNLIWLPKTTNELTNIDDGIFKTFIDKRYITCTAFSSKDSSTDKHIP